MAKKFAKLRGRIIEKFGSLTAFAEAIGMKYKVFTSRMSGAVGWTFEEVVKICSALDIPLADAPIFFNP